MNQHIEILQEAKHEIQQLRRRNEVLAAKVEVMDSFMQVLNTRPAELNQTFAPDIVFGIEQEIGRLEYERLPQAAVPVQPPVDNAHVAPGCERFSA